MFSSSQKKKKKKTLATYSKKAPRTNHRSTFASPTSNDRQHRKRRVTLSSPVRGDSPPSSLSSISLSLPEQLDQEDDEVSQSETNLTRSKIQRRLNVPTEPAQPHELAFATSPDRLASPVSSSEHDSISDEDMMPAGRGNKKHTQRATKPQSLSKLRKSLNVRPKKLQLVKAPTSGFSAETLRDIERGADGFDEMHLVLLTVSKPRNTKRKGFNSTLKLDILNGPQSPVDFDNSDWSTVPYQDFFAQEHKETFDTAETPQEERGAEEQFVDNVRPKEEGFNSLSRPPTRPSAKEVLIYAQLSSVSAPIMRRSSYEEGSEDGYANGFLDEGNDDPEQMMSDADQEELGAGTLR
jgi:hypothetical protein